MHFRPCCLSLSRELGYRRGTARRATSLEILPPAVQLYDKITFDKACNSMNDLEGHLESSELMEKFAPGRWSGLGMAVWEPKNTKFETYMYPAGLATLLAHFYRATLY